MKGSHSTVWNDRCDRTEDVLEAHRLVYHSTLGLRVIKKKKTEDVSAKPRAEGGVQGVPRSQGAARPYRGTSLIRNTNPHRITIGP